METALTLFNPELPGVVNGADPTTLARQADDFFDKQQYQQAADLYQQLLAVPQDDVDTCNNLGITLHQLGRSAQGGCRQAAGRNNLAAPAHPCATRHRDVLSNGCSASGACSPCPRAPSLDAAHQFTLPTARPVLIAASGYE